MIYPLPIVHYDTEFGKSILFVKRSYDGKIHGSIIFVDFS